MSVHLWGGKPYTYAEYGKSKKSKKIKRPHANKDTKWRLFCRYVKQMDDTRLRRFLSRLFNHLYRFHKKGRKLQDFIEEYRPLLRESKLQKTDYRVKRAYLFFLDIDSKVFLKKKQNSNSTAKKGE
ncbi:MAG: hypothetical protein J6V90_07950 [Treponema sp.]|nr:hypothetical protein [Treponema sp.]